MNGGLLKTYTTANEDTIAAIATPPGTGGIAVIRVSGAAAFHVTDAAFRGTGVLSDATTHTIHYGRLVDTNETPLDEVLASVFRAPNSYTGEDVVEISCHGGPAVTRRILERILECGSRHALPGEFTRRAFLNGKIDLAQAEAVADMIHAQTEEARAASMRMLEGRLSSFVRELREQLIHTASMLELALDFAEEGAAFLSREEVAAELEKTKSRLHAAIASYAAGRIVRDGVRVVITGKPNVGKSSLLNALIGEDRAIVTDIPGTTRDYIEESTIINGELFRFIDTAGLRDAGDIVEQEGIRRARSVIEQADILCRVADVSNGYLEKGEWKDFDEKDSVRGIWPTLVILNKVDLLRNEGRQRLRDEHVPGIAVSAATGEGLDELRNALTQQVRSLHSPTESGEVLVTNLRHREMLEKACSAVDRAMQASSLGMTEEIIAFEIRQALSSLGEIIGAVVTDDILNTIFARFCIGK